MSQQQSVSAAGHHFISRGRCLTFNPLLSNYFKIKLSTTLSSLPLAEICLAFKGSKMLLPVKEFWVSLWLWIIGILKYNRSLRNFTSDNGALQLCHLRWFLHSYIVWLSGSSSLLQGRWEVGAGKGNPRYKWKSQEWGGIEMQDSDFEWKSNWVEKT